jgi:hypothetical protein
MPCPPSALICVPPASSADQALSSTMGPLFANPLVGRCRDARPELVRAPAMLHCHSPPNRLIDPCSSASILLRFVVDLLHKRRTSYPALAALPLDPHLFGRLRLSYRGASGIGGCHEGDARRWRCTRGMHRHALNRGNVARRCRGGRPVLPYRQDVARPPPRSPSVETGEWLG